MIYINEQWYASNQDNSKNIPLFKRPFTIMDIKEIPPLGKDNRIHLNERIPSSMSEPGLENIRDNLSRYINPDDFYGVYISGVYYPTTYLPYLIFKNLLVYGYNDMDLTGTDRINNFIIKKDDNILVKVENNVLNINESPISVKTGQIIDKDFLGFIGATNITNGEVSVDTQFYIIVIEWEQDSLTGVIDTYLYALDGESYRTNILTVINAFDTSNKPYEPERPNNGTYFVYNFKTDEGTSEQLYIGGIKEPIKMKLGDEFISYSTSYKRAQWLKRTETPEEVATLTGSVMRPSGWNSYALTDKMISHFSPHVLNSTEGYHVTYEDNSQYVVTTGSDLYTSSYNPIDVDRIFNLYGNEGDYNNNRALGGIILARGIGEDGLVTDETEFYYIDLAYTSQNEAQIRIPLGHAVRSTSEGYITNNPLWEIKAWLLGKTLEVHGSVGPEDPWGSEDSKPGGGGGSHNGSSDTIDVPGLPPSRVLESGLIGMWNPSTAQLTDINSVLWSSNIWDSIAKVLRNPLDVIQNLFVMPVSPSTGAAKELYLAGFGLNVNVTPVTSQYKQYDMGTLHIDPYWKTFMDYEPYTKITLYLPFIGDIDIKSTDVMDKDINIKYRVDFMNGTCLALIYVNGSLYYQKEGLMKYDLALASSNRDYISAALGIVGGGLGAIAGVGAIAAGGAGALGGAMALTSGIGSVTQGLSQGLSDDVSHSGSMGSNTGYMGVNYPYVRILRPRQNIPTTMAKDKGYMSNISAKLSELSGFTMVDSIHLDGINATEQEITEIMQLLKDGVIL